MTLKDGYHDVPAGKLALVVTYLEMKKAAPLRGTSLPEGLMFEILPPDITTYRTLFRKIGSDWLWFERLLLSDEDLGDVLNMSGIERFTLTRNNIPLALLELDYRNNTHCELVYFGLASDLIGTGAGSYLMDRAIEIAWSSCISRLHLHTCTIDSPQALNFYLRSGFKAYKRRVEIADDPRLTGYLPQSVASHVPML